MKKLFHLFQKKRPTGTTPASEPVTEKVAVKKETAAQNRSTSSSTPPASNHAVQVTPPREIYADDGDLGYC